MYVRLGTDRRGGGGANVKYHMINVISSFEGMFIGLWLLINSTLTLITAGIVCMPVVEDKSLTPGGERKRGEREGKKK